MKVHEKSAVFRQGEVMPFSWTEVGFMMDYPEGITLRFNLTSEKEQVHQIIFRVIYWLRLETVFNRCIRFCIYTTCLWIDIYFL